MLYHAEIPAASFSSFPTYPPPFSQEFHEIN